MPMAESSSVTVAARRHPALRLGIAMFRAAGLGLLVWLFLRSSGSLEEMGAALAAASPTFFLAALLLYVFGLGLNALRIAWLLRSLGHRVGVWALMGDIVKAIALNALVTTGSGELYRVQRLRGRGLGTMQSGSAVLVDRVMGVGVMLCCGLIGCLVVGGVWASGGATWMALGAVGIAVLGLVAVAFPRLLAHWVNRVGPHLPPKRTLAGLLLLSLGMLSCWVMSVSFLARALSLGVGFDVLFFVAPLVALGTLLPISVGGIGIREAGYALLLAPYGVSAGDAVALGLLQYGTFLVVAVLGGVILIVEWGLGRRVLRTPASDERALDAEHDFPTAHEGPPDSTLLPDTVSAKRGVDPRGGLQRMGQECAQRPTREVTLDDRGSAV